MNYMNSCYDSLQDALKLTRIQFLDPNVIYIPGYDNQVTISGCPTKFLVVRTSNKVLVIAGTSNCCDWVSQLGSQNLWVSARQLHPVVFWVVWRLFWLSRAHGQPKFWTLTITHTDMYVHALAINNSRRTLSMEWCYEFYSIEIYLMYQAFSISLHVFRWRNITLWKGTKWMRTNSILAVRHQLFHL